MLPRGRREIRPIASDAHVIENDTGVEADLAFGIAV
jgi:hypothetical protein